VPNYTQIADDVAANEGIDLANAEAAFARMSAETITQDTDISVGDVKGYLIISDKWLAIKHSNEVVAEVVLDAFDAFDSFQITHPTMGAVYKAKLTEMLDNLIALGLVDATDKAVILGMGARTSPKWPGLKPGYVYNAIEWRMAGEA
jgi:hypothetical protein